MLLLLTLFSWTSPSHCSLATAVEAVTATTSTLSDKSHPLLCTLSAGSLDRPLQTFAEGGRSEFRLLIYRSSTPHPQHYKPWTEYSNETQNSARKDSDDLEQVPSHSMPRNYSEMIKPRSSRASNEQAMTSRNKSDSSANGPAVQRNQVQLSNPQTTAQAIRKRRSSINVYDQPSSLNSRLRQLETDMLRLDEDRTKLFDDTHASLATYELRLNEINAILKSRQDNVDKYVEDMKLLLQAKEEFEKQAKMLNEKHDRIHEKFTHRETTISREIKLLKNKFELLEKSRQFRSLLQKSNSGNLASSDNNEDLISGLESTTESQRTRSETGSEAASLIQGDSKRPLKARQTSKNASKSVRIKLPKTFIPFKRILTPIFVGFSGKRALGKKSNRVGSLTAVPAQTEVADEIPAPTGAVAASSEAPNTMAADVEPAKLPADEETQGSRVGDGLVETGADQVVESSSPAAAAQATTKKKKGKKGGILGRLFG